MEKIFDNDFRNELFRCLKESGMKDKEVSGIINKRYKEALKKAVIERLNAVVKAIKEDNLEAINAMIEYILQEMVMVVITITFLLKILLIARILEML